jgi:hypothetical protein
MFKMKVTRNLKIIILVQPIKFKLIFIPIDLYQIKEKFYKIGRFILIFFYFNDINVSNFIIFCVTAVVI